MCDSEIKARLATERWIREAGARGEGWWALSSVPVRVPRGNTDLDVLVGIPGSGLLIIEVKAWSEFAVDEFGVWSQRRNAQSEWTDEGQGPYVQAQREEYLLAELLFVLRQKRIISNVPLPRIGSCVLFGNQNSGVQLPDLLSTFTLFRDTFCHSRETDSAAATGVLNRLQDMLRNQVADVKGKDNSRERLAEIRDALSLESNVRGLGAFIDESIIHVEQLSQNVFSERAAVFGGSRLYVEGAAGTGKTVYALKLAIQRARETQRPALYVCYSRLLAQEMREVSWIKGSNVIVATPEELLVSHGGERQLRDFEAAEIRSRESAAEVARLMGQAAPKAIPRAYLGSAHFTEVLVGQLALAGSEFSAVVVDEAQDLSEELLEGLSTLTGPADLFAVFADPRQTTRRERSGINWTKPASLRDAVEQRLEKNFRNGDRIIDRVESEFSTLRYRRPELGSPEGVVETRTYSKRSELVPTVIKFHSELVLEDLKPVILVSAVHESELQELRVNGLQPIDVDDFKGLEDRCVMLVIGPDPNPLDPNREDLYVGLTRANSFLAIVERKLTQQDKR